ncbi:DUF445 family protein [Tissierella sp.]|uniref:DUF445 family protein n=1 Tax=Tissierella sp. TaxID=41274 RepID=UPI0028A59A06|nr:DUF445 family protein [Tissierella sp.]
MKILIPIIVGATIGYFTNWLAIKMLFRPHYERKIMGIKVPFTPGLIPKERHRIAKSIGETVGVYLLSPETIIESLSNKKKDREIRLWLEDKVNKLKESHQSIKEVLVNLLNENYYRFIEVIENNLKDIIISQIRGKHIKSMIFNSIEDKVNNINSEEIYKLVDERLKETLLQLSNSQELKNGLANKLELKLKELIEDERKISELIPKDILISINKYIDENGNQIGNSIKDGFKDPNIQIKIKDSISDLVSQNVNKLIAAFISPDLISDKVFHMIEKYIESEEANDSIIMIVKSSIDKLLESKTSEMAKRLTNSMDNEMPIKIADILLKYISNEENYSILLGSVQDKLKDLEVDNKEKIRNYLNTNIDTILNSDELEESISTFTQDIIEQFLNKPISFMAEKIDEDTLTIVYNFIRTIFDKFAIHELPRIIEIFDVSKIVEDKVNSFDVDFAEELILEIANKELKAITWLGALLGGVLGLLSPLIQMLY